MKNSLNHKLNEEIVKMSELVNSKFTELDNIVAGANLSKEQKESILKTRNGLFEAIGKQDEKSIMDTIKNFTNGNINN